MNRLIAMLMFALLLGAGSAPAAEGGAGFEAANQLYEKGDYAAAAKAYSALIEEGPRSPAVLFNLGNAHFKAGELGAAIAAYRRAETLAPRDPDVRANLRFARDRVGGDSLRSTAAARLLGKLSVNEWATLAGVAWWTLFGLLTASRLRPSLGAGLRTWTFLSAGGAFVVAVCLVLAHQASRPGRYAVVTATEAMVRNGPLEESKAAFTLRDGAEVELLDRKDDWVRAGVSPNKTGWVRQTDLSVLWP